MFVCLEGYHSTKKTINTELWLNAFTPIVRLPNVSASRSWLEDRS